MALKKPTAAPRTAETPSEESPETVAPAVKRRAQKAQPALPLLARWAGALLLAAALFSMAAIMAFGVFGRGSVWGWAFVAAGALSLLGWFAGRRQGERLSPDKYAKQRVLLGTNAVASVLLLAVLLVGVNYVAARRHKTFDLTSNRVNSLADQTYKALEQLPEPVRMTYVYVPRDRSGQPDAAAVALLDTYKNASDKVRIEYLNAAASPIQMRDLNLTSFTGQPVLLVEAAKASGNSGNKDKDKTDAKQPASAARQEVAVVDEQNVTSALLKLKTPQARVVYFLSGHGEISAVGPGGARSMAHAKAALEAQNYITKALSLTQAKAMVPADAAALIVAAPQVDLSPAEEKKLKGYIAGKGRLVLLLGLANGTQPRWQSVAKALGVEMSSGIVVDFERFSGNSPATVSVMVDDATRHPLLRGVPANVNVLFPGALPLRKLSSAPAGVTTTILFESSTQSYDRIPRRGDAVQAQAGPFVLAAASERTTAGAPNAPSSAAGGMRAVVVSNADFVTDQALLFYGQSSGNLSFFLAAVNWTVGNEALVSIPPKPPVTNTINLDSKTGVFVSLFSLFALPMLVLIIGGVVWWTRR